LGRAKTAFQNQRLIIKTANMTQTAVGDKNGLWTTAIAAAVFVPQKTANRQDQPKPPNNPYAFLSLNKEEYN
jgi:hypothetical protein